MDRNKYSSNKFTINEDDQFDILKVERLGAEDKIDENKRFHDLLTPNECFKNVSSKDLKNAQERLQKRREIIQAKLKVLEACSGIVDLFFFGFYEYKTLDGDKYPSKPRSLAIKNIIQSRDTRKFAGCFLVRGLKMFPVLVTGPCAWIPDLE